MSLPPLEPTGTGADPAESAFVRYRRNDTPGSASRVASGDKRRGDKAALGARGVISQPLLIAALLLFDIVTLFASGVFSYIASAATAASGLMLLGALTVTLVALAVLKRRWCYTISSLGDFAGQSISFAFALAVGLIVWDADALLTGISGGGQDELLRLWTLRWAFWGAALGVAGRASLALAVRRWTHEGRLGRRTIVVGGGEQALETIHRLEQSCGGSLNILGVFDDRDRTRLAAGIDDYQLLGAFADLEKFCRDENVDLLIFALPVTAETRILQIMQQLWSLPIDVRISALSSKLKLRDRAYSYIGDVPFLPMFDKPMSDWSVALKAVFDYSVAGLLVLALAPLLALLALGVKLSSPGPVFFVQKRYGFNNQEFGVFKFRSMSTEDCHPSAENLVTRDDPRVTKFGAFLRRTSLDELPQLFNVLRGDLSLVGPRPHMVKGKVEGLKYENVVDNYFARHRVKPGMTGWAQINGWRGAADTFEKIEQRVAHDLYYIEHWSLWFDIKILAMTPWAVLVGKNAF